MPHALQTNSRRTRFFPRARPPSLCCSPLSGSGDREAALLPTQPTLYFLFPFPFLTHLLFPSFPSNFFFLSLSQAAGAAATVGKKRKKYGSVVENRGVEKKTGNKTSVLSSPASAGRGVGGGIGRGGDNQGGDGQGGDGGGRASSLGGLPHGYDGAWALGGPSGGGGGGTSSLGGLPRGGGGGPSQRAAASALAPFSRAAAASARAPLSGAAASARAPLSREAAASARAPLSGEAAASARAPLRPARPSLEALRGDDIYSRLGAYYEACEARALMPSLAQFEGGIFLTLDYYPPPPAPATEAAGVASPSAGAAAGAQQQQRQQQQQQQRQQQQQQHEQQQKLQLQKQQHEQQQKLQLQEHYQQQQEHYQQQQQQQQQQRYQQQQQRYQQQQQRYQQQQQRYEMQQQYQQHCHQQQQQQHQQYQQQQKLQLQLQEHHQQQQEHYQQQQQQQHQQQQQRYQQQQQRYQQQQQRYEMQQQYQQQQYQKQQQQVRPPALLVDRDAEMDDPDDSGDSGDSDEDLSSEWPGGEEEATEEEESEDPDLEDPPAAPAAASARATQSGRASSAAARLATQLAKQLEIVSSSSSGAATAQLLQELGAFAPAFASSGGGRTGAQSSSFEGVTWYVPAQKWQSHLFVPGQRKYPRSLGQYPNQEAAARVYDMAVRSRTLSKKLNFPKEGGWPATAEAVLTGKLEVRFFLFSAVNSVSSFFFLRTFLSVLRLSSSTLERARGASAHSILRATEMLSLVPRRRAPLSERRR
jgi:hypothetical protein